MAYISNQDEDELVNQVQSQQGPPQSSQQVSGGSTPSSTSTAVNPNNKQSSSGQFTNLQKYVDANKNRVQLGSQIQNQRQGIEQNNQDIQNKVNQTIQDNTVDNTKVQDFTNFFDQKSSNPKNTQASQYQTLIQYPDKAKANTVTKLGSGEAYDDNSKNQVEYAKDILNKQYSGVSDYNQAQDEINKNYGSDLQKYNQNVELTKTDAGQRQLLDNQFGSGKSSGVKDLNFSVFNQDSNQQNLLREEQNNQNALAEFNKQMQEASNINLANTRNNLINSQNQMRATAQANADAFYKNLSELLTKAQGIQTANAANYKDPTKNMFYKADNLNRAKEYQAFVGKAFNNDINGDGLVGMNRTNGYLGGGTANAYDFYAALGDTNKLGLGMDVNLNPETAKYLKLNKDATDKFATLDTGDFLGINNIDPAQAKYYNDLANLLGLNTITGVTDEQARLGAMGYNSQGQTNYRNDIIKEINDMNVGTKHLSEGGGNWLSSWQKDWSTPDLVAFGNQALDLLAGKGVTNLAPNYKFFGGNGNDDYAHWLNWNGGDPSQAGRGYWK